VAGVFRELADLGIGEHPLIGVHRPYARSEEMKLLSADQAISVPQVAREEVFKYLLEMGVPSRYFDIMYSVPKDDVYWLTTVEFERDFEGFIPGLGDWVDVSCDKLSASEKTFWTENNHRYHNELTPEERTIMDAIHSKLQYKHKCEDLARGILSLKAFADFFGPKHAGENVAQPR
jgi:hypothetical protein